MKKMIVAAALVTAGTTALAAAPMVAQAQTAPSASAPNPTVGAKVFGPDGSDVGTIEAVAGDVVTVYTGTVRAALPKTAFAVREKGLTIGMNKGQLEAAVQGAQAQNTAAKDKALVADAPIKSSDGKVIGTISKIDGENVTVALTGGTSAMLTKSNIGLGADGALVIGMTEADFTKAASAASTAAPAGAATPAATATPGQ